MDRFAMRVMLFSLMGWFLTFSSVWAQADLVLYRVEGVSVDVTAPSAAQARDDAIVLAQHKALAQLVERLGASGAAENLSDEMVGGLVQAFEIQKEYASKGHYSGTYAVQFRPLSVRALLDKNGKEYTETQFRPLVVLPVLKTPEKNVLWEDSTLWHDAWQRLSQGKTLVPLIVPSGDLDDIAIISTDEVLENDPNRLKTIIDKYHASGVLIAFLDARFDAADELESGEIKVVQIMIGSDKKEEYRLVLSESSDDEEKESSVVEMLEAGAQEIVNQVVDHWKDKTSKTLGVGSVSTMPVTVRVPTLAAWIAMKEVLEQVPSVVRHNVVTMSRGSVHIELVFKGTIPKLQEALENAMIYLDEDKPGEWEMKGEF